MLTPGATSTARLHTYLLHLDTHLTICSALVAVSTLSHSRRRQVIKQSRVRGRATPRRIKLFALSVLQRLVPEVIIIQLIVMNMDSSYRFADLLGDFTSGRLERAPNSVLDWYSEPVAVRHTKTRYCQWINNPEASSCPLCEIGAEFLHIANNHGMTQPRDLAGAGCAIVSACNVLSNLRMRD